MTREYLVTKLVCAKCGHNLNLTYDTPKSAGRCVAGEPTGAAMVQQFIAVEPCKTCFRPQEDMLEAARLLIKAAGSD